MGGTKYTKDRQLEIGKEIFNHEYTVYTAASRYDVSPYTARDYLRRYL